MRLNIFQDLRTGLHKGFAFISFQNDDFYENIKKFEGKHIIDDEEVICSLANQEKSLLLTDTGTVLGSENSSEINISETASRDKAGIIEFIRSEANIRKKVRREGNPKIISTSSMDFQNTRKWVKGTNLLQKPWKKNDVKERGKNLFEKTVMTKLTNLVQENESNNEMYEKTYITMRPSNDFRENVTRSIFSVRTGSSNRSFRIPIVEATNQEDLKKESNSGHVENSGSSSSHSTS